MRLWTLHPKYLDARGLVAVWREALLAQAVLRGDTVGYRHHPQLDRFRSCADPLGGIADYLRGLHDEAGKRHYRFDVARIDTARSDGPIEVGRGQLEHEWRHLMAKLRLRDPGWRTRFIGIRRPSVHPLFRAVPGGIASWERLVP